MGLRRRWGQRELGGVPTRQGTSPQMSRHIVARKVWNRRTYGDDVSLQKNQSSEGLAETGLLFISTLKEQRHSWWSQEATRVRRPRRVVPALSSLGLWTQTRDCAEKAPLQILGIENKFQSWKFHPLFLCPGSNSFNSLGSLPTVMCGQARSGVSQLCLQRTR